MERRKGPQPLLLFILILPLLFLSLTVLSSGIGHALTTPTVRVGISLSANHLVVSINSGDVLSIVPGGVSIPLSPGIYIMENSGGGIRIINAAGHNCGIFNAPLQLTPAQGIFYIGNARNGSRYRGLLEVGVQGGGVISAVNILDLESYLQGVIALEMPAAWGNEGGMEALKAQAVVARTYALGSEKHQGDPFQLCDRGHCCQMYGGINAGTTNTDRAVDETRSMILIWNGRPIEAFYHASNGGHTECPANVWVSSYPYLRSEPDPFDDPGVPDLRLHPHAVWQAEIPLGFLNSLLVRQGIYNPVESVHIASVFSSGRVNELKISGGGRSLSFYRGQARTVLNLNSQLYRIREQAEPRVWIASAGSGKTEKTSYTSLEGKWVLRGQGAKQVLPAGQFSAQAAGRRETVPYMSYIIEGQGRGHGIGMSQYGAFNRARSGHTFEEILNFYYPGTMLERAY